MFHDIHLSITCINLWSKNMNVSSITPKLEENITIMKALEYLAFGLEPYVDDGEYLAALNRITKRTDSYFLTEKKMVEAAAILASLVCSRKLKLHQRDLIPVVLGKTISSSTTIFPDNYAENKIPPTISNYNKIDNDPINSVQIKYITMNKNDSLPSYLKGTSLSIIPSSGSNNYYIPVCIIDYGFSLFIYPDHQGIIKFSELKPLHKIKSISSEKKVGRPEKTNYVEILRCYLEHLEECHPEQKNHMQQKGEIYHTIAEEINKTKTKKNKIQDSTVEAELNKFIDILWGKSVKITNQKRY